MGVVPRGLPRSLLIKDGLNESYASPFLGRRPSRSIQPWIAFFEGDVQSPRSLLSSTEKLQNRDMRRHSIIWRCATQRVLALPKMRFLLRIGIAKLRYKGMPPRSVTLGRATP